MDNNQRAEAFPTFDVSSPADPQSSASRASFFPTTATNSNRLRPTPRRENSIRLRRLPSASSVRLNEQQSRVSAQSDEDAHSTGRRRSGSAPSRTDWPITPGVEPHRPTHMDTLVEEAPHPALIVPADKVDNAAPVGGRLRSASAAARSMLSRRSLASNEPAVEQGHEYDQYVIDLLDVVDPEVQTLTSLVNVQNSLFVPDLGRWLNRRPTYELTRRPTDILEQDTPLASRAATRYKTALDRQEEQDDRDLEEAAEGIVRRERTRRDSITSNISDSHYAVLPHGVSLEGWSEEDKRELNDHVRHFLHSRRSKFKRSMRAFGKYIQKPLGFFVTLYAVLITLFGLAWVLFLIGWINIGGRQSYLINVIDNVLVALFAVMGDGLAPFRAVDTYHMCFIAHYHHLTWRLRKERDMPKLEDRNDLPKEIPRDMNDLEAAASGLKQMSMLSPLQQKRLEHHQKKFAKSHSFYKPHETETHHAFPLRLLVAVVCLLDCHSLFQIALGTCTWAINYHTRPQALTATILCCSITCNITAGIVITVGDRKTRKKDVIKKMFIQELTVEAIDKVNERRVKEQERSKARGLEEGEDLPDLSAQKLTSR